MDAGRFEGAAEVEQRYSMMPASLERALLPFQREGVRFGIQRRGRALIADEMGAFSTFKCFARVGTPLLASCSNGVELEQPRDLRIDLPESY